MGLYLFIPFGHYFHSIFLRVKDNSEEAVPDKSAIGENNSLIITLFTIHLESKG